MYRFRLALNRRSLRARATTGALSIRTVVAAVEDLSAAAVFLPVDALSYHSLGSRQGTWERAPDCHPLAARRLRASA